jgi:predicted dehydrogenase
MLKALIVGCGKIAGGQDNEKSTHAGVYLANNGVEIVACFDIDTAKGKIFSEVYHCQAEQNLQDALDKHQPDIVSVCTPDNTHFETAKNILTSKQNPKLIFLEKPACQTDTELDELIILSEQNDIPIVVNHTRRFDQHHQQLRERIAEDEFGDLVTVNITYYSGWEHNGVHIIDSLSFLFDDSIEIKEITNKIESPYPNDLTLELKATFKQSSAKINITSFEENFYQLFEIDIRFTNARLRLEDFGERILLEKKYINDIDENVIKLVDNGLRDKTETPMEQAIAKIVQSLEQNNSTLLDGFLLQDISQTMQTIWQGQKMAEQI